MCHCVQGAGEGSASPRGGNPNKKLRSSEDKKRQTRGSGSDAVAETANNDQTPAGGASANQGIISSESGKTKTDENMSSNISTSSGASGSKLFTVPEDRVASEASDDGDAAGGDLCLTQEELATELGPFPCNICGGFKLQQPPPPSLNIAGKTVTELNFIHAAFSVSSVGCLLNRKYAEK